MTTLIPVTVKQLVNAKSLLSKRQFVLNGEILTGIVLVGVLRSVDTTSVTFECLIEDETGTIKVKLNGSSLDTQLRINGPEAEHPFLSNHEPDPPQLCYSQYISQTALLLLQINTYVRVIGELQQDFYASRRQIVAAHIMPLDDCNEITNHMLLTILTHLQRSKNKETAYLKTASDNSKEETSSSHSIILDKSKRRGRHSDGAEELRNGGHKAGRKRYNSEIFLDEENFNEPQKQQSNVEKATKKPFSELPFVNNSHNYLETLCSTKYNYQKSINLKNDTNKTKRNTTSKLVNSPNEPEKKLADISNKAVLEKVYSVICTFNFQLEGLHFKEIHREVGLEFPPSMVKRNIDFLIEKGMVHTTAEDMHYRASYG
ncbi:hypothetical protein BB559_001232 [Furculomyces boomerangus]|uniref:Replication protein A C-terminal domain-containing protein n=2 Tax=Harpellales TaxID=61421 RepID=A0A2T9Z2T0_9FUNG|nr:hypothetical protein BB559_001232 [Furculomyces boomerangus]PWA00682.1 hypothetical protein BB558_003266 [Smittium angustum]